MTPFPPPSRAPSGVAVFADAHLGQAEGDVDDFLAALAEAAGRGLTTIVLLGDIFHYFIGDAKFETPLVRKVLGAWRDLAASGVSLRYVEGNRDFFLAGTRWAAPFAVYGETDGLEVGKVRYAFVHGDRVNTRDLPYRLWRRLSKNSVSRASLALIPGPLARAIVAETEKRLYRTNFRHKTRLPEAELLAEGRRARKAGYDQLLVGHFHVERLLETPDAVTHVLPAWLEERKHVEIDASGRLAVIEEPSASRAVKRDYGFA
ncbi:MAG: UDP-2,3-diacylglucosamine diphosphatase [Thermoanaerobaculia bacterium]